MNMTNVTVGSLIDHYKILEEIGRGGMGVVFKALNVNLDKVVAVKTIALGLSSDEIFLNRFRTEARALARLHDPNIVSIYDLRLDDNQWFIVMEYVQGITLAKRIREENIIPWRESLDIFKQMISAIGHAHRLGIIHRDIKPNNVMITNSGVVKVTDFGLAKDQQNNNHTIVSSTGGTLYYMSPEQIKGLHYTDFRSDIYALGLTFYEMLTGKIPFRKDDTDFTIREAIIRREFPPPTHFNSDVPLGLNNIVMRSIEKKPEDRFQTIDAIFEAINDFEQESGLVPEAAETPVEKQDISSVPEPAYDISFFSDTVPQQVIPGVPATKKNRFFSLGKATIALIVFIAALALIYFYPGKSTYLPVMIVSQPEQALVYINDDSVGVTPFYSDQISHSSFSLQVKKDSFLTRDTLVYLDNDTLNYLSFLLTPLARFSLNFYPENAAVHINEQKYDIRPSDEIQLPPGDYLVSVTHDEYESFSQTIALQPGSNPAISAQLTKKTSEISTPVYANVYINSTPTDAMIYYRDRYLGNTPFQHTNLDPGYYEVTLKKDGFRDYSERIFIAAGQSKQLQFQLQRILTNLNITSEPADANVWIDNRLIQSKRTPLKVDSLTSGMHLVRIEHDGYKAFQQEIELNDQIQNDLHATLSVSQGLLNITVQPWGSIYINDQLKKKNTNIKYSCTLSGGDHVIKVVHPIFGEWKKTVRIRDGETINLPVNFNDQVNLSVTAFDAEGKPIWAEIIIDNESTGELTPKEISVRIGQRTIAAKKEGYILVNGAQKLMLDKQVKEPIKFIFKKAM
jgi:serine/threonine protein kinase